MAERVSAGLAHPQWTPSEGRRFAFPVGAAFLVLAGILWWRSHPTVATALAAIGGLLLLAGLLLPAHLGPVYRAWMAMAHAISRVTTPIFMGIVYFLVITPVGLLMRAVGRNPLVHRSEAGGSYWLPRTGPTGPRSDLERQF